MIAAVRVRGPVDVPAKASKTLEDLKLTQKNQIVVFEENDSIKGMMSRAKDYIAFGEISDETVEALEEKKGSELESGDVLNCRPPKKGFKNTRMQYGQGGTLGKNDEIDDLVQRMV
jgi:large subunit ribosomal protein L30